MRFLRAWRTPAYRSAEPDPVAPVSADGLELAARIADVQARLVGFLDGQAVLWPEDRNGDARDLALDVALLLGLRLPRSGDEPAVPVTPGRAS